MHNSVQFVNTQILNGFTVGYEITMHTHFSNVAFNLLFDALLILHYAIVGEFVYHRNSANAKYNPVYNLVM